MWRLVREHVLHRRDSLSHFYPGVIFMFITASAPNKHSLGATNGLSQMAVSIARAIGPAMSTSLFSFSVENNILEVLALYFLRHPLSSCVTTRNPSAFQSVETT